MALEVPKTVLGPRRPGAGFPIKIDTVSAHPLNTSLGAIIHPTLKSGKAKIIGQFSGGRGASRSSDKSRFSGKRTII